LLFLFFAILNVFSSPFSSSGQGAGATGLIPSAAIFFFSSAATAVLSLATSISAYSHSSST
jgi:hypothetical protein